MSAALARGRPARAPETLLLTRRDIAALMDHAAWLEAVEGGFRAAAEGRAQAPPPLALHGVGGAFHGKGATIALERQYAAVKVNANFPCNPVLRGLPTIQGALLLFDAECGTLLSIMDSIEITLRRTAAATALAARHLARPDAQTILICGCGAQGAAQLAALREFLPLRRVLAWDLDPNRVSAFAADPGNGGIAVEPVAHLANAAALSDVIVTCTTARDPFLTAACVRPGTFVAAVGADSPGKSEIDPDLMPSALVVADLLDQCIVMGDLRRAILSGSMTVGDVHAELGDLVVGRKPGRSDEAQITLFDSTGTALQDVASAALIYERASKGSEPRSILLDEAA